MPDPDTDEGAFASPVPAQTAAEQIVAALIQRDPSSAEDRIERTAPEPAEGRRRLVTRWAAKVRADKRHHQRAFDRMRRNGAFVYGEQWDQDPDLGAVLPDRRDPRYVVNVALRHVQQRTASLYATNPTVLVKKRERMLATVWDGDMATLQQAQQEMAQAVQMQAQIAAQSGQRVVPGTPPPGMSPQSAAILADFKNVQVYTRMLDRVGKTLQLLWEYNVAEQVAFPFKTMMKMTVRRAIVTGVGYVKLGFQRAAKMNPEIVTRIADMKERIAHIERMADDIADGETPPDGAEAEQLKLAVQALMAEPKIILREGLLFDYPASTSIIPDRRCLSLRGFLGANHVTQEYLMTADEVQEVYGVDIGQRFTPYTENGTSRSPSGSHDSSGDDEDCDEPFAAVWEIYSRKDGLVYPVCDGYPDFLREPAAPDTALDRFWPWFPIVLNEGVHERELFPKSDIDLLRDMQLELNRAREGLREHRRANRPKTVTSAGSLDQPDKDKLATHPANALIELNGLQPGQKVEDLLQPMKMTPIDPALYDTNPTFEDLLRVLGTDQAATGQTTSATATEVSVAQGAQHTDLASCVDDQDDLLTELAQAAGKLLLLNVSAATVQKVIGPGAVWPELTAEDVAENIYMTVRAGSTGRPNKQQEVQNAQILFPMLQRVPNINPEWMARELIRRLDDRLDLTEAFVEGMPSMDALNRIQGTVATPPPQDPQNPQAQQAQANPTAGGGGGAPMAPPMGGAPNDPTAQGVQGDRNAVAPPPTNGLLGPRTPPVPGANGLMPGHGGGPHLTPQGGVPTP